MCRCAIGPIVPPVYVCLCDWVFIWKMNETTELIYQIEICYGGFFFFFRFMPLKLKCYEINEL